MNLDSSAFTHVRSDKREVSRSRRVAKADYVDRRNPSFEFLRLCFSEKKDENKRRRKEEYIRRVISCRAIFYPISRRRGLAKYPFLSKILDSIPFSSFRGTSARISLLWSQKISERLAPEREREREKEGQGGRERKNAIASFSAGRAAEITEHQ